MSNEPMNRAPIWHATQCGMTAVVRSSCTARYLHHSLLVTVGAASQTILIHIAVSQGQDQQVYFTNMTNADSALVTDQNRAEQFQQSASQQNRTELTTKPEQNSTANALLTEQNRTICTVSMTKATAEEKENYIYYCSKKCFSGSKTGALRANGPPCCNSSFQWQATPRWKPVR